MSHLVGEMPGGIAADVDKVDLVLGVLPEHRGGARVSSPPFVRPVGRCYSRAHHHETSAASRKRR